MSQTSHIPKLTDNNYYQWSFQIELLLKSKGLWSFAQTQNDSLEEDKVEKDGRAQGIIGLHVESKFFSAIRDQKIAYSVCNALKECFTTSATTSILLLKCRYHQARMEPDESLLAYLDWIKDIVDQLTALESTTEDKELCYKIVTTLTSDYEPLVMQLKDE